MGLRVTKASRRNDVLEGGFQVGIVTRLCIDEANAKPLRGARLLIHEGIRISSHEQLGTLLVGTVINVQPPGRPKVRAGMRYTSQLQGFVGRIIPGM
jgi:hypothetical protein